MNKKVKKNFLTLIQNLQLIPKHTEKGIRKALRPLSKSADEWYNKGALRDKDIRVLGMIVGSDHPFSYSFHSTDPIGSWIT